MTTYTMLDTPGATLSSYTNNTVTITWPAVTHANKYLVQLDNNTIIDTNSNELTYVFTGINPGDSNTYKVQALIRSPSMGYVYSTSDWGQTTFTIPTPTPTPLPDPTISFPTKTTSTIGVNWTSVNGATGYKVYNNSDVLLLTTSDTSHTFTQLSSGTNYFYKVKAYYGTQLSLGNNLTSAYTMLDTPALALSSYTNNTVTIAWPSVDRANKYLVQLDNNTIIDTNSNALTYVFTGINPGDSHTYKVQALIRSPSMGYVYSTSDWGQATFTIPTNTPTPTPTPTLTATPTATPTP